MTLEQVDKFQSFEMSKNMHHYQKNTGGWVQVDQCMRVKPVFSDEQNKMVSLVVVELDGEHSKRVNTSSAKTFFIESGSAEFEIDDNKYSAKPGDTVFVPPSAHLLIRGVECKMLIFCAPAFNTKDETIFADSAQSAD